MPFRIWNQIFVAFTIFLQLLNLLTPLFDQEIIICGTRYLPIVNQITKALLILEDLIKANQFLAQSEDFRRCQSHFSHQNDRFLPKQRQWRHYDVTSSQNYKQWNILTKKWAPKSEHIRQGSFWKKRISKAQSVQKKKEKENRRKNEILLIIYIYTK